MQEVQKSVKIDLNKLIVMPISELLKKKHNVLIHARQVESAKRLQKWFRNRQMAKKRGFAPFGIWEIKKMVDAVITI